MATYQEIKIKISKLEEQAKALLQKESATVVAKIRGLMSDYGLTVQDLGLGITNMGKKMSAMKNPLPPKYQDPVSGKTWSGKGKAPGWIVEATKKGKRDDFLIGKATAKPEVKKAAAAKKAAPKKTVVAKPIAANKPAAKKATPAPKKAAVAKKAAPVKVAAKPATKPAVKKAVVTKKVAPIAKSAPKAAVTTSAAPTAPKA